MNYILVVYFVSAIFGNWWLQRLVSFSFSPEVSCMQEKSHEMLSSINKSRIKIQIRKHNWQFSATLDSDIIIALEKILARYMYFALYLVDNNRAIRGSSTKCIMKVTKNISIYCWKIQTAQPDLLVLFGEEN